MKLMELPLIMEGFHQIKADQPMGIWYINRWADIPDGWEQWFMRVERILGQVTGLTCSALFSEHSVPPEWYHSIAQPGDLALPLIYVGVDDSPKDIMRAIGGVTDERIEEVENLFETFFDGAPDSDHARMVQLFVTNRYQV